MNRINRLFQTKQHHILSVYFTAGHPELNSAPAIIKALTDAGVDMIEIGMPFSDPMADGPIIQSSSSTALKNGMSIRLLFRQLADIRKTVDLPLLLMGYLNPVLQYGFDKFCNDCAAIGIDGLILPDLPLQVYQDEYRIYYERNDLHNIFLISPQTGTDRIRLIDATSNGFIYMVSSSSTTGIKGSFGPEQVSYFKRIQEMQIRNPTLVGFGISNHDSFETVCRYTGGAVIGSAFVKMLSESKDLVKDIKRFVGEIREGTV
jgi:tryptophan synthase alpha chain